MPLYKREVTHRIDSTSAGIQCHRAIVMSDSTLRLATADVFIACVLLAHCSLAAGSTLELVELGRELALHLAEDTCIRGQAAEAEKCLQGRPKPADSPQAEQVEVHYLDSLFFLLFLVIVVAIVFVELRTLLILHVESE